MIKINLGCGLSTADNWENIDGSPTVLIQKLPVFGVFFRLITSPKFPASVKYGDVRTGLPFPNESVDIIYSSHMLEHLSLEDFRLALEEIQRILKPGGVFRSVIPDLEVSIKDYLACSNTNASSQFLRNTMLGVEKRPRGFLTKCRSLFGNSNHLWMWDFKGIQEELKNAGFYDIRRSYFNDSQTVDFLEVEDYERWNNCLGFECKKTD